MWGRTIAAPRGHVNRPPRARHQMDSSGAGLQVGAVAGWAIAAASAIIRPMNGGRAPCPAFGSTSGSLAPRDATLSAARAVDELPMTPAGDEPSSAIPGMDDRRDPGAAAVIGVDACRREPRRSSLSMPAERMGVRDAPMTRDPRPASSATRVRCAQVKARSSMRETRPPTATVPSSAGRTCSSEPIPWWMVRGRPRRAPMTTAAAPVASSSAMPRPGAK